MERLYILYPLEVLTFEPRTPQDDRKYEPKRTDPNEHGGLAYEIQSGVYAPPRLLLLWFGHSNDGIQDGGMRAFHVFHLPHNEACTACTQYQYTKADGYND
jgi:hypothetical protein